MTACMFNYIIIIIIIFIIIIRLTYDLFLPLLVPLFFIEIFLCISVIFMQAV